MPPLCIYFVCVLMQGVDQWKYFIYCIDSAIQALPFTPHTKVYRLNIDLLTAAFQFLMNFEHNWHEPSQQYSKIKFSGRHGKICM